MQVGDTLIGFEDRFMALKEQEVSKFNHKPCTIHTHNSPLHFHGMTICMEKNDAIIIDMS